MKKAHFFWSGPSLPYLYYLSLYSFRKLNPDWEVILYTSFDDLDKPTWTTGEQGDGVSHSGPNYFERCRDTADEVVVFDFEDIGFDNALHPVHKADILRQYLMCEVGGLWSDMDILWVKSMSDVYDETLSKVDITFCYQKKAFVSGVTYSTGSNNSIYRNILKHIQSSYAMAGRKIEQYQAAGPDTLYLTQLQGDLGKNKNIFEITSLPFGSNIVTGAAIGMRAINLRQNYFCPFWYNEVDKIFSPEKFSEKGYELLPKDTIGLHWFGGAEGSSDAVKTLSHEVVKEDWAPGSLIEHLIKETIVTP